MIIFYDLRLVLGNRVRDSHTDPLVCFVLLQVSFYHSDIKPQVRRTASTCSFDSFFRSSLQHHLELPLRHVTKGMNSSDQVKSIGHRGVGHCIAISGTNAFKSDRGFSGGASTLNHVGTASLDGDRFCAHAALCFYAWAIIGSTLRPCEVHEAKLVLQHVRQHSS